MKKCPYCGHSIEDDVYHCPKCLAGIPQNEEVAEEPVEEHKQSSRRKVRS